VAASSCIGQQLFPELNEVCIQQTSEKSCLSYFAFETEKISGTCRWVTEDGAVSKELQEIYTEYGATWFSNITSEKAATASSFALKVSIPGSAKNKWTGYLSLEAGPKNKKVGPGVTYVDPRRAFTFSGCQFSTSCELKQTIPASVSPSSSFIPSGFGFTALTTDPVLINQFNANGYVYDTYPFKLRVESTWTSAAGNPPATPAISDNIQFGPTNYIMDDISPMDSKLHYTVITYKSYEISMVTEANWKANVGASLASNGKKTNITSMLMTEKAYYQYFGLKQQYLGNCTTTCKPPTSLAISGTVCTGLKCAKSAKNLNSSLRYRLVVSYPTITSLSSANAYSLKPMTSTFAKEMVKTEVFAKGWKIPVRRTTTATVTTSRQSSGGRDAASTSVAVF
jgi:hypothetical protein